MEHRIGYLPPLELCLSRELKASIWGCRNAAVTDIPVILHSQSQCYARWF
ncbi:hypothetical protein SAMN05216570_0142 [Dyella sp. OK004]|nr:hypothetical protein SAMN05216570_0142 [Dyella sp. OK004]